MADGPLILEASLVEKGACLGRAHKLLTADQPQTLAQLRSAWFPDRPPKDHQLVQYSVYLKGDRERSKPVDANEFALFTAYQYLQQVEAVAVVFTYKDDPGYTPPTPRPAVNAFEHLMAARSDSKYLPPPTPCRDGTDRPRNAVIVWLRSVRKIGFKRDEVATKGEALVHGLVKVLFCITKSMWEQMMQQPASYRPPEHMEVLTGFRNMMHRQPRVQDFLDNALRHLETLEAFLWLQQACFEKLRANLAQLRASLAQYQSRLADQLARQQQLHQRQDTTVTLQSKMSMEACVPEADRSKLSEQQQQVAQRLHAAGLYQPLPLSDLMPSAEGNTASKQRQRFIEGLKAHCTTPFTLWEWSAGSRAGGMQYYVWRMPAAEADRDLSLMCRAALQCSRMQDEYHSRQMRQRLIGAIGPLVPCGVSRSLLRLFYREATGDASAVDNRVQRAVLDRLLSKVLDSGCPELVADLRVSNGGQEQQCFDAFWAAVDDICAEYVAATDERRHGGVYSGIAISIADLHRLAVQRMEQQAQQQQLAGGQIKVPSVAWFALQFQPKSPSSNNSLRYTGRFQLKMMVQKRTMRKEHQDAHYCAAAFRYQRELAQLLAGDAIFVCLDDKAKADVGEPATPIAAVARSRGAVPGVAGQDIQASDHDFHCFNLTPSVILESHIAAGESSGYFHRGTLHVSVKCSTFQPSSALRHMAELREVIKARAAAISVLLAYSDGGPDHNIKHKSVQLALLALLLLLDLDDVIVLRCAPYSSWRNPAERCMASLNFALQHCALSRSLMPPQFEAAVKGANSMAAIRRAADTTPGLEEACAASMAAPIQQVSERFSRLQYSDEPVQVHEAAGPEQLQELMAVLQQIQPGLESLSVSAKELAVKHPKLAAVLAAHVVSNDYSWQFGKVEGCTCVACEAGIIKPRRGQQTVAPLPLPIPQPDGTGGTVGELHYQPFSALYGKKDADGTYVQPDPSHQPSRKPARAAQPAAGRAAKAKPVHPADQSSKAVLQRAKLRGTVRCGSCNVLRCIFSSSMLSPEQRAVLEDACQEGNYLCGQPLLESDHLMHQTLLVRQGLGCGDHAEHEYYKAANPQANPRNLDMCCWCGDEDGVRSSEGMMPVCERCVELGFDTDVREVKKAKAAVPAARAAKANKRAGKRQRRAAQQVEMEEEEVLVVEEEEEEEEEMMLSESDSEGAGGVQQQQQQQQLGARPRRACAVQQRWRSNMGGSDDDSAED